MFSVSFLITFLSPETATCIDMFLFIITDYDVRFIVKGWFCRLALVGSVIQLPYLYDLLLLIY
jgi:hypothetical protein